MGGSKVQRLVSHLRSSSWLLSFLLWSVLIPFGPPVKTHGGKVAIEIQEKRKINSHQPCCDISHNQLHLPTGLKKIKGLTVYAFL